MPTALAAIGSAIVNAASAVGVGAANLAAGAGFGLGASGAIGNFLTGALTLGFAGGTGFAATAGGLLGSTMLSTGLNALSRQVPVGRAQLQATVGATGPRTIVMGRTAVAGQLLTPTPTYSGKNGRTTTLGYALSGAGPSGVVESVLWGDDTVTFSSGQAVGKFDNDMWLSQKNGSWTQTAITAIKDHPSEWNSNRRGRGCLIVLFQFDAEAKAFGGVAQTPIFVVDANAVELTDPRTGTLATTQAQRRNPAVWAYNWHLGFYAPSAVTPGGVDIRVMGMGTPIGSLDTAWFDAWADLCDDEGWTIAGELSAADDRYAVLTAIMAVGMAQPTQRYGLESGVVSAPTAAVGTITEDDLASDVEVLGNVPAGLLPNHIVPRFRHEPAKWQFVDGSPVTDTDWLTADGGIRRSVSRDYAYAPGAAQAAVIAAYEGYNAREPLRAVVRVKPSRRYLALAGDCVLVTLPRYGLSAYKMRVGAIQINDDLTAVYTLVTETDSKHAKALGKTTTPPEFIYTGDFDNTTTPQPDADIWTATAATISDGGATLPIIRVEGLPTDYARVSAVIAYWRPTSASEYVSQAEVTGGALEITGLTPGTEYEVAIAYRNPVGVEGAVRVLAAVTTGEIVIPGADEPMNLVAGGGPVYMPGFEQAGWLGEPGTRWEIASSTDALLGSAMWRVALSGSSWEEVLSPRFAIAAGETLSVAGKLARIGTWSAGDVGLALTYYDASGDPVGSPAVVGWALDGTSLGGGAYAIKSEGMTVPSGAVEASLCIGVAGGTGTGYAGAWRMKVNRGARVTAWSDEATNAYMWTNKIGRNLLLPDGTIATGDALLNTLVERMEGAASISVNYDFTGLVSPGELPRSLVVRRWAGAVDVSEDALWAVSGEGVTASVINGAVTVSGLTAAARRVSVTSTRGTLTLRHDIDIARLIASPPVTGGAGAVRATDTTFDPVIADVLTTGGAGPLTVRAGASGTIVVTANLAYSTNFGATVRAAGRVRYRVGAGAWEWAAAEVLASTYATSGLEPELGSIDLSVNVTGLTSGTDYEFELQLRRADGSGLIYPTGVFSVEAV